MPYAKRHFTLSPRFFFILKSSSSNLRDAPVILRGSGKSRARGGPSPSAPRSARSLAAGNRTKSGGAILMIGIQGVRTSFSVSYHFLRFVGPYLWKPNKL